MKKFISATIAVGLFLAMSGSTEAQELEYVNSLYWTAAYDVAVEGDYAYYCFDPGLVICDISNIENPTFVSRLYIPGDNYGIKVADNYAVIFGDHDSLRIIDINDPGNPQVLGKIAIDAEVGNIWIDGNYIYVAAGYMGMLIIDISDPCSPEIITQFETDGDTEGVVVVDTLAFISERFIYPISKSFQVVNISDRINPFLVGYLTDNIGWNRDLIVEGDYAYLANTFEGFIIIDISNPAQPSILSQMEDITYPRYISKMGNYVFMDSCYRVLHVVDVTDPELPEIAVNYEIDGGAFEFELSSDYLFTAGSYGGMSILNVSNIENIFQVAAYDAPGAASSVFKVGDYLYTAESGLGLHIHDLTNPEYPNRISQYELPTYYYSYYLKENLLYALSGSELKIIDVSDPSSPDELLTHTFYNDFNDVCVNGSYIYFTSFSTGVSIYELILPDSLEFVRDFICYEYSFDGEIEDNIGYFSLCFVLQIYDLTNPEDSVLLGSIMPSSGAGNLYLHNGFIYTQLEDGSLDLSVSIIDVTDPTNPSQIGLISFPNHLTGIHFNNELAYFSIYPNELYIYDVSDPYNPIMLCNYNTPGYIRKTFAYGNYTYVADNSSFIILRYNTTGIEETAEVPISFSYCSNYPNPFNSSTIIEYDISSTSDVRIDVFNLMGQRVETLIDGRQIPGKYTVSWNASGMASGIYFYKLTAGGRVFTRRMTLLK